MSASPQERPRPRRRRRRRSSASVSRLTILPGVGLIDLDDPGVAGKLAERLADKVGGQLMVFAERMQEGACCPPGWPSALNWTSSPSSWKPTPGARGQAQPRSLRLPPRPRGGQRDPGRAPGAGAPASGALHRRA